jgi:hypothetical protein
MTKVSMRINLCPQEKNQKKLIEKYCVIQNK